MSKATDSLNGLTHKVQDGAEKLVEAVSREWQAAQDSLLDSAHGATLEDRPSPGFHPCEPSDLAIEPVVLTNPDAKPLP